MSNANLMVAALVGGVIGFAGSVAWFTPKVNSLTQEIAQRPPVIVVDMIKLAVDAVPVGAGEEAVKEHFRNVQGLIDRFNEAGFLVLSRENVLSASDDLMLGVEDIPPNRFLTENLDEPDD